MFHIGLSKQGFLIREIMPLLLYSLRVDFNSKDFAIIASNKISKFQFLEFGKIIFVFPSTFQSLIIL